MSSQGNVVNSHVVPSNSRDLRTWSISRSSTAFRGREEPYLSHDQTPQPTRHVESSYYPLIVQLIRMKGGDMNMADNISTRCGGN